MSKFIKYPKTIHADDTTFMLNNSDVMYYETEKLHGANMSIIITKDGYKVAKRTTIITNKDNQFNNFFTWLENNEAIIEQSRKLLNDNIIQVNIFGEFFGENINRFPYDIDFDFKVFNVFTLDKNDDIVILNLVNILKNNILDTKYLIPIKEIKPLKYFIQKNEPLDKSDYGKICEGSVYSPVESYCYQKEGFKSIKHKTKEFCETNGKIKVKNFISDTLGIREEEIVKYITISRMNNLLSYNNYKFYNSDIPQIFEEYKSDIVAEFTINNKIKDNYINRKYINIILNKYSKDIYDMIKKQYRLLKKI